MRYSLYLILFLFINLNSYAVTKIKFATVAPDGTSWMKAMRNYDKELQKQTKGRVKFIFYPGGVAGDEKDILRKMRYKKIHATGITGVGMGKIVPSSRILDLPYFFKNVDEVDLVHEKLFNHFKNEFDKKGYVLISWSEIGWTYLFSNKNIQDISSYPKLKMWFWEGDEIALKTLQTLKMNPVSLSIGDVLTSLQTGLIDTIYTPPLAALAMQWNTKVKYMLNTPIVHASGAFVILKKIYNSLSKQDQQILSSLGKKHLKKLTEQTRTENENAINKMKETGITILDSNDEIIKTLKNLSNNIKNTFLNKLYDQALLDKVNAVKGNK